jgi:hypothetical protein
MFLFYLGHIPAFADIHLSAHFKDALTEPADFARLFERGKSIASSIDDQYADGQGTSKVSTPMLKILQKLITPTQPFPRRLRIGQHSRKYWLTNARLEND